MTDPKELKKAIIAALVEKKDYTAVLDHLNTDGQSLFGEDATQMRDLIMSALAEKGEYKTILSHITKGEKQTKEQKALTEVVKPFTDIAQLIIGNTKGDFMSDLVADMDGKLSKKGEELLSNLTDSISAFQLETKAVIDDATTESIARLAKTEADLKASLLELATTVVASKASELLPSVSQQAKLTKAEIDEIIYQTALSVESQVSTLLGDYVAEQGISSSQILDFKEAVQAVVPQVDFSTVEVDWSQIKNAPEPSQGGTSAILVKRMIEEALAGFSGGSGVPNGGTTGQVLTKASNTDGDANWQDPTGGVTRSEYVTVGFSDADYICDGTADNVQIQAAIDEVVANGGGIVYIKNGTYSIADSLVLQSNVTVLGDEFSTVLSLANGVNKSVFVNLNTATEVDVKISIQKLTIFGNKANQTSSTTVNGISFINVEDFLIADVIISNCAYDGVRLNSCERGDIRDVTSSQNTSSGIIVLNGGGDYKISNCTTNTNSDEGIKIAGVSRVQISNHYSKGNGQDGIKVEEFGGAGSQFISVIGAYLDDNDDGIHIRDGSDNFYFSNIVASNNDKSGILVQDCDNFTVTNSIFHTNKFNGIGISGSVNFTVTGNAIYNNNQEQLGNDYSGIKVTAYLGRESETGTISGNSIYDNQGTKTQQYGVRSTDSSSKLAVVANSIGAQAVSAISLVGTNTVASNDIPSGELRVENFISRTGAGLAYLNNVNDSFGVGITAPDTKVHIQATSSGASLPLIKAQNNATAAGTATEIVLTNTTATGVKHAGIAAVRTNSPSSESTDLVFYNTQTSATRFVEKMRLDALGRLSVVGDVTVPDEAYDATAWDGSLEVPTKNAIRDKIDTMDTAIAGKANTSHTHVIADTTGLQTALDGKAATSHTHTKSQVTDFQHSITGTEHTFPGGTTNFLRADGTFAAPPSGFADPLTTNGDIIARIAGATTRLPQGANGTFLGVSGGALGYYTPPGGGSGITEAQARTIARRYAVALG